MNDTTPSDHSFPSYLSFFLDNPLRKLLEPPTKVLELLDIAANNVVVDFGCGTGYYTIPLAKQVHKVIGVDVHPEMLKKAKKQAEKHSLNIEFLQSDGTQIHLPDSTVDLILLIRVFHEINDKNKVLKEFKRILKQEGRVAIKEKTKKSLALIGPPIVKVSEITKHMEHEGLKVVNQIEIGSETLIITQLSTNIKD